MTRAAIPNLLTALRIVLGVAVFFALAAASAKLPKPTLMAVVLIYGAFIAYAGGAITDFFDGWLARRWNVASIWGAILDPIADKIAVVAAVLGLMLLEPRFEIALPGFAILCRELFVSGLREVAAGRGVRFPVTQLAKWKTTIQLVALSLAILALGIDAEFRAHVSHAYGGSVRDFPHTPMYEFLPQGDVQAFAVVLLWIAAALTLWTGWGYASAARTQLKG